MGTVTTVKRAVSAVMLTAATAVASGCGEGPVEASHADLHSAARPSAAVIPFKLLKQVRNETARFQSTEVASRSGYVVASPCVSVPGLGTMGFHWVKQELVDPVFQPLRPEAVLYLPDATGKLQLVAVEYIVINVGQPAPTFDGQPFDVGGTPVPVPHWSLHAWIHRENPSGVFTPFNPALACPEDR